MKYRVLRHKWNEQAERAGIITLPLVHPVDFKYSVERNHYIGLCIIYYVRFFDAQRFFLKN